MERQAMDQIMNSWRLKKLIGELYGLSILDIYNVHKA